MAKFSLRFFNNLPAHEKKITVSTLLTIARIIVTPFIVIGMATGYWGVAFALFVCAAITDVLDGFLARLRNERTFLGAALDPVADKILLLSCFFTLAFIQTPLFAVPHWFVLLVLFKELIVIGGSVVVYCRRGELNIAPTKLGKATTVIQVCFIVWLFACYFF